MTVNTPDLAYAEAEEHWPLIHDLLGGTLAMRKAEKTWLPQEEAETPKSYAARLDRSVLYNGFKKALRDIASRPFAKPATIKFEIEGEDEFLAGIADNIDGKGSNLTSFARELMEDGATYGVAHTLTDFPTTEATSNRATEKKSGVRAYIRRIAPPDLIGWKTRQDESGKTIVTEARIREEKVVTNEDYEQAVKRRVRLITETEWKVYELDAKEGEDGEWKVVEEGKNTLGRVPLSTAYFERAGVLVGRPPLEDLAWVNLMHWQSQSDQRNILRLARFGVFFMKGVRDEEVKKIVLGPSNLVHSKNPDADMKVVEHSGAAIGAGEKDLERLEARMETLGMAPFVQSTADQTATARSLDETSRQSQVQAWIRELELTLERAIVLAAEWQKQTIPGFSVAIFSEFATTLSADRDVNALIQMRQDGELSRKTFFAELIRRGILSDSLDMDEEAEALDEESADRIRKELEIQRELDGSADGEPEGGGGDGDE